MSGFFGVFSPGGNIDKVAFDQMQKAIHREGYDELETHVDDCISMGHLMLRITAESFYDKQPLSSSCGRYILVGHFRLDYRDELGDKLGLTQKDLELTPDSLLVLLSFLKWKKNCVNHLEGDWCFVIYDKVEVRLNCFKDKFGVSALYYAIHEGQFIFATSLLCFHELIGNTFSIDLHQLYRLSFEGVGLDNSRTMFNGVFFLFPCTYLIIDSNLYLEQSEYYELNIRTKVKYKYEQDYISDYLYFFSNSIKSRISTLNDIGIFQSSGLDSNAILYFASKELEFKEAEIFTYTACNCYLHKIDKKFYSLISDDELFKKSLHLYNNVNPSFLDFCRVSFKNEFQQSVFDFDNPVVTKSKFWLRGIIQNAKKDNVRLMFTGQLGNFTITWNAPQILLSNLVKLRFFIVLKGLRALSIKYNLSFYSVVKTQIISPGIVHLKNWVKSFNGNLKKKIKDSSVYKVQIENPINWKKEFTKSNSVFRIPLVLNSNELRKQLFYLNARVTGIRWYNEGFTNALLTSDPTVDIRLVDFLFSIPEQYYNKDGSLKFLFRKMMENRIYEPLLENNNTIEQTFDLGYRILADPFFSLYIEKIEQDVSLNEIFKIGAIKDMFNQLKSCKSDFSSYQIGLKLLKDISIVYLYDNYDRRNE